MRGCRDCQKVWTYSISGEQLNVLLEDAECATCGSKERLCIDHDHVTGKVRGMLCDDCNLALGKVKDSIDTLTRMVEYLKFSATGQ